LSLDEDVARLLEKESRRSGASFKEVVNRFLRLGLIAATRPPRKAFVVTPRKLGLPPGRTYDNVEQLLDALEGPARRRSISTRTFFFTPTTVRPQSTQKPAPGWRMCFRKRRR